MAFSTSLAARIGTRAATLCQQSASEERVRCPITATPAPQLRGRSASSKDPRVALGAASFRQVFGATHTRARHVVMAATAGGDAEPLAVMVNSCAGKMGHATAVSVVQAGLTLIPFSLNATDGADDVEGTEVALVGKERHTEVLQDMKAKYPNLVIVDFTLPHVVTENCEFYAKQGVNFVVGTTGGDSARMLKAAEDAGVYAVIAPNMGKQIVAAQAMVEMLAERFPGAFSGYKLSVVESHQKTKADTSGTAKAVVESMGALGCDPFDPATDIEMLRDDKSSNERLGVPMDAMNGHAFHTYTLTSPSGDVEIAVQHNVIGRTVYAEGSVDACIFLARRAAEGADKKIYNMVDVLESGFMR